MTPSAVRQEIEELEVEIERLAPIVKEHRTQSLILIVSANVLILVAILTTFRIFYVAMVVLALHFVWEFRGVNDRAELSAKRDIAQSLRWALRIAFSIKEAELLEWLKVEKNKNAS